MSHFKGPDFATDLPEFQPNISVLKLLEEGLKKNDDATAMVEGQTGRTASFKDLLEQSTAISVGLRRAGVTAGDYVIMCCDKSIAAYSTLLGIIFTGATAVLYPTPHVNSVPELTRGFPIKAVFCDRQYHGALTRSMSEMSPQPVLVAVTEPQDEVFTSLLSAQGRLELYEVKDVNKHVAMVLFSSGTTGIPKGIQLSDVAVQLCGRYKQLKIKTFFISSPIFWLSGTMTMAASVLKKFKLILSNSTNPKENLTLLEKYKVDKWFSGTGSLPRYINELSQHTYDLSSVDTLIVGGETMLSSVVEFFKTNMMQGRIHFNISYASTEAGMICDLDEDLTTGQFLNGVCGYLHPEVEMKITDEEGRIVPVGDLGEVRVRCPSMTPGYWGRPELHDEVFDKDGFFLTGDVGYFDQKQQLFLRGRVEDVIDYKGTKISPAEVEDVLMSHPAVVEAAVVGKSHPTDIQLMTAYVVIRPGHEVTEKELQTIVDGKVADNSSLKGGVYFLDVLPRTIIGKVMRKRLREM